VTTLIGTIKIPIKQSSTIKTRIFSIRQELNREHNVGSLGRVAAGELFVEQTDGTLKTRRGSELL
jgi:hypothetical protein